MADRPWVVLDEVAGPPRPRGAAAPALQAVVERLAAGVTGLLRGAGVPRVDRGAWAADLAVSDADGDRRSGPDLVLAVAAHAVPAACGDPWRSGGVPLLPVTILADRVVVGPVVRPVVGQALGPVARSEAGRSLPDRRESAPTPGGPTACLRCLELTRTAGWTSGRMVADPAGDEGQVPPKPVRDGPDAGVVAVATGLVTILARAVLVGSAVPVGVSVEVSMEPSLPWPRLDHRRWTRHPACDRHTEDVDVRCPTGSSGAPPRGRADGHTDESGRAEHGGAARSGRFLHERSGGQVTMRR